MLSPDGSISYIHVFVFILEKIFKNEKLFTNFKELLHFGLQISNDSGILDQQIKARR